MPSHQPTSRFIPTGLGQCKEANTPSSKMIRSIPGQHRSQLVALPVDAAVGCSLLQAMACSWLINSAKLELERCGKQTVSLQRMQLPWISACFLGLFLILSSIADIPLVFLESLGAPTVTGCNKKLVFTILFILIWGSLCRILNILHGKNACTSAELSGHFCSL